MKRKLHFNFLILMLFLLPNIGFAQSVNLGSAANYAIYSTGGAVTNDGTIFKTRVTGNIGTSSDPTLPGFGNIDGNLTNVSNLVTNTQLDLDVLSAYNDLSVAIPTFFPAPLLGNGQILVPGVYDIAGPTVLNLTLTLDGQNNPNSIFIIKIGGAFSSSANAKVKLINGALACNVYWKVEGLVSLATGTSMKGTIVANNSAIVMTVGDTLEGRAISIEGAITVTELFAYLPTGCGSPTLSGPIAPNLGNAGCFALFSSNGVNTNVGITHVTGDVGTNGPSDLTTGYNALLVNGNIHPIPDLVTAQAAADLLVGYNYMVGLDPGDIQLLRPDLFGHELVLTPHTYLMLGAVTFTDTVYLDARGNANAVFIINVNGAFSTSVNSKVKLINGAQAKNVYWKIDGSVTIADNSVFNGTLVVNGAINLNTGVQLNGRALTISGAINVQASNAIMQTPCAPQITTSPTNQTVCLGSSVSFNAIATGAGLTYQWRRGLVNIVNSASISGAQTATLTINPTQLSDAGLNYNVVVSGTYAPSATSNNVSLTLNSAPTITVQPTNQTVCLGSSVIFGVTATGTNLSYQWRKGLVNLVNGVSISGANSALLTINPTSALDVAANYNVVVSGTCSPNATSNNVSLTLNSAPTITVQPTNQTVCLGSSVIFGVTATGTNVSYQWRKGLVNLVNGVSVSGATSASLTINPTSALDVAANYNVVVSGTCLPNATSNNVSLTLNSAPTITVQPTNQTVCLGSSVIFGVTATGTNVSYQWRKGLVNLVNGVSVSGATSAALTINPTSALDVAANYNVVVSGTCSPNATSNNVSLTLNTAPTITVQPTNQTVCLGSSATFGVTATGTNLSYQWRKGLVNLVNGVSISGANSATLTINPTSALDVAANYNVVVSGTCLPNATSNNVSLILNAAPTITVQPTNQTVCLGSSVTFGVTATGTNLFYQWRKGLVNLVNGVSVSGATSASLTINPTSALDVAANYNVVVSGTCSPNATSNNVSLTLNSAPTITVQPTNQTVCLGSSVTFGVTATGTNLFYQWRKGLVNLVNGVSVSGATSASLTINPTSALDVAANYNVVVSGTCLPNATSNNVSLTLNSAPAITVQPTNQTVCLGSSVTFGVTATGTNLFYQWRKGLVNLVNGVSVSGANSASMTINPTSALDVAANYNVVVSGTCSPNATSSNVSLTLNAAPTITVQPTNQTVCLGSSVSFGVTATGTNLSYQWRKGLVNLVNGVSISGANSASMTINPTSALDVAANYNVVVSGTCSPNATSSNVSLTLNAAPTITVQPTNQTVCLGSSVSFGVTATGTNLSYQWRKGLVNLVNGISISGANSASMTINPTSALDVAANYNVVVSGTCSPNATSNNVSLTLNSAPTITVQPTNQTVCLGSSVTFGVTATGTNVSYQWRKGLVNLVNGVSVSGANSASLTINPTSALDVAANYNVVVSGTCSPNATSNNVSLTLNSAPAITVQPTNQTVCLGSSVTFGVTATGTNVSYQWRKGLVNLVNGVSVSGANSASLTINPTSALDVAANYNVVVSGTCSPNATSNNVSLTLNSAPAITVQPTNQTVCLGSSVTFDVTATGTNLSFQWRKGLVNLVNGVSVSGATSASLTINPTSALDAAANYNVVVSGTCLPNATSNNVSLTLNSAPTITVQPTNQTVCLGSSVTFDVTATGTNISYQWRKGLVNLVNNATISGANSASLTINPTSALDAATNYNVVISGTCSPNSISVNVELILTPNPIAIPTSNSVICDGNPILLSAVSVSGATYSWSGPNGFTSTDQNPTIANSDTTQSGTYSLVIEVSGCFSASVSTEVKVDNCDSLDFFIPEGFSPNGDGINDLFVIRGIQFYPNNDFMIFNRWGDKIFDTHGYLNTWDGKNSNGVTVGTDELPVGTYFYVLDLGDGSDIFKGPIYLNR